MTEERRKRAAAWRRLAEVSSVGLAFPLAMAIGYFWGKGLDQLFGTEKIFTIVFSLFGIAAGFLNAFRIALRVGKEEDREMTNGRPGA